MSRARWHLSAAVASPCRPIFIYSLMNLPPFGVESPAIVMSGPAQLASRSHPSRCTPHPMHAPYRAADILLVTHPYSHSHGWLNLFRSRRALQTCLQAAPQATIYWLNPPDSATASGKQLPTAELYICLHGSEVLRWRSPSLARHWALASMRAAKKILTVSEPIADLCRQSFPQFAEKVQAVNNALPDATRTDCLRAQSVESAAKHSTPSIERNPTLHLLSVGRIHPRKGFHQVLEALSRLNPINEREFTTPSLAPLANTALFDQIEKYGCAPWHSTGTATDCTPKPCTPVTKKRSSLRSPVSAIATASKALDWSI